MTRIRFSALFMCIAVLFSIIGGSYAYAVSYTPVTLKYYDDRMDISGMTVEITDSGAPTSNKVGFGIANDQKDSAVITLSGSELIASGVGTAKVKINGIEYTVEIETAPLSLFLLMGQSNMEGSDGNAGQSVANENGQVYSTYGDKSLLLESNAGTFVPSALAGDYSIINTEGTTENISSFPTNMLCEAGNGKKGIDSALAYEWNQQTGKKVWIVNVANGGSLQQSWLPGNENYLRMKSTMTAVYKTLQAEIKAGHYTLDRMGYFWLQGCSDSAMTAKTYADNYLSMHNSIKSDLLFDHDGDPSTEERTVEFGNILMVRAATDVGGAGYRQGSYSSTDLTYAQSYQDLQMTGPRVAQYWLAANKNYPDINVVSNITEKWVTMPDGTNGVSDYFKAYYDKGKVDYPTQTSQLSTWYSPKFPVNVHPTVHYLQIGYNELGRDAARNTCYILGEIEPPTSEVSVKLLSWDGYTEFDTSSIGTTAGSDSLAVPVADPVYFSKNIEISLSDGLDYDYFDLTGSGSISISCKATVNAPDVFRWEFDGRDLVSVNTSGERLNILNKLSGTTDDNGILDSTQYKLQNDIVLMASRKWSVEWKAEAGEYMLFVSNSKAYTEGTKYLYISKNNNGISLGERITAYNGCGVDLTDSDISIADTHIYKLVNTPSSTQGNTITLYVDGKAVGEMAQHNTAGVWDDTVSDWLSGQDFRFSYLGATPYTLKNCKIEYIEVNEGVINEDSSTYTLTVDGVSREVKAGDTVEISAPRAKSGNGIGYGFDHWESEQTLNFNAQSCVASFVMPPADITVNSVYYIVGNLDGDNSVSMLDIFEMKKILSTFSAPTKTADINFDGEVTMLDSFLLKSILLNKYDFSQLDNIH